MQGFEVLEDLIGFFMGMLEILIGFAIVLPRKLQERTQMGIWDPIKQIRGTPQPSSRNSKLLVHSKEWLNVNAVPLGS